MVLRVVCDDETLALLICFRIADRSSRTNLSPALPENEELSGNNDLEKDYVESNSAILYRPFYTREKITYPLVTNRQQHKHQITGLRRMEITEVFTCSRDNF